MKKGIQIGVCTFSILALLLITMGVSYALVQYPEEEYNHDIVYDEEIKFLYTVNAEDLRGVMISDFTPTADSVGKKSKMDYSYFDFKVAANVPLDKEYEYEITLKKSEDSTLDDSMVKVYLTELKDDEEVAMDTCFNNDKTIKTYRELSNSSLVGSEDDKVLYSGVATGNYARNYRLRIWLAEDIDLSSFILEDGTYLNRIFSLELQVSMKS